jgi:hypothetical protein
VLPLPHILTNMRFQPVLNDEIILYMKIDEALSIVVKELTHEGGMLFKISDNQGIDELAFESLKEALGIIKVYYQREGSVPKKLAFCFIDLTPVFERTIEYYSEEEKNVIEDIRNYIVSEAEEIMSVH